MDFGKRIRKLDVFKKVPSDFSQATNMGGLLSIATLFFILFFLYTQLSAYISPPYHAQIWFDRMFTRQQMTINLDIEFPAFPCQIISLDLVDVMISHHPNIGSTQKWRLDQHGNYIDSRPFELLREGNPFKQIEIAKEAFKKKYGCRLKGSFTVKEVPGNFHISTHAYFTHFMELKLQGVIDKLNMTHIIHSLYFGKESHLQKLKRLHPQANVDGLTNTTRIHHGQSSNYHLDIVPTWYHEGFMSNFYTYQYTHLHNTFSKDQQPGIVHFHYHIGGINVEILPERQGIWSLLGRLCAVIGGIYALASVLMKWLQKIGGKWEYQLIQ